MYSSVNTLLMYEFTTQPEMAKMQNSLHSRTHKIVRKEKEIVDQMKMM